MAYNSGIVTSIFGRRLGLQTLSSSQSGGTRVPAPEYLVGPEALRQSVTTGETTASNLYPSGISYLTTAQSSGIYTIDPPVPGIEKTLIFATTGTNPIYVRTSTDASITIATSQGTTMCVISSSQAEFTALKLVGATTASWVALNAVSSSYLRMSTTT